MGSTLRARIITTALPESSLQGTNDDLQSALNFLLSRMDKMEPNIASVTETHNLLYASRKSNCPRAGSGFFFTLIHQSINEMMWVSKLGLCLRNYAQ